MKKILLITLLLINLCGCNSRISKVDEPAPIDFVTELIQLGYKQESAEIIDKLSDDLKEEIKSIGYDIDLEKLLLINSSEEIINYYLNNDISTVLLFNLLKDKFFMLKNIDLYIKYEKEFDNIRSLIEYVNTKSYKEPFVDAIDSDTTKDIFMIASKLYYLDKYEPDDLVNVEDGYGIINKSSLRRFAWDAYKKMADDARNNGLDFYISTAYRSYDFQNTLYNKYLQTDSQEIVDTYSSRPGYSDHQIGLSCDIRTKENAFEKFTETEEAKWLKDNAYKYGFIMRYPEEKENITGYMYESWHYRYVGIDAAEIIYENNITFDEYYAYYVE